MADAARVGVGAEGLVTDGPCGELIRLIVNSAAQAETHLIVALERH